MSTYTSPLCSCIICKKVLSQKGVHSHFISAHTELGIIQAKINLTKGLKTFLENQKINTKKKLDLDIKQYEKNPCRCLGCNIALSFKRRKNTFCTQSCSAKYSNAKRDKQCYIDSAASLSKIFAEIQNYPRKPDHIGRIIESGENIYFTKISQCVCCNKFFPGLKKTCSKVCYSKKLSDIAKNNPKMGGNKNTRAYGWYESPYAGKVWLESSYEYEVAKSLDENGIKWIRPPYLPYGSKKYFADFYLSDFNVYLDPKNEYLITKDKDKINQVMDENNVKIFILTKNQLSWDSIHKVLDLGFEPRMG